jgi:uncharacterized protein YpmS
MSLDHKRTFLLLLTVLSLVIAGLACNLPGRGLGRTESTPIPVSEASVGELATQVASAAATAISGGPIVLEFTEQQLTSAAALELQSTGDTPVSNIQVFLRDGVIRVSGTANQGGFDLPLSVALRITVNAQGMPQTDVMEAKIGPLSLPQSVTDQFTANFNQLLVSRLAQEAGSVAIESITIADGKMTIVAYPR